MEYNREDAIETLKAIKYGYYNSDRKDSIIIGELLSAIRYILLNSHIEIPRE